VPQYATIIKGHQVGRLYPRGLSLNDYLNTRWSRLHRPLAAILYGDFEPPERGWPQVSSPFSPLGGGGGWVEVFLSPEPTHRLPHPRYSICATEDLLFAAYSGSNEGPMAEQAEHIYGELLQLTEHAGYPHLLRAWHAIPDIHGDEDGLERYQQFCLGRQKAFARHRAGPPSWFPAASVLGAGQDGLGLFALAARAPGLTVENPNQVSAYRYPPIHGPSSPSFSRALVTSVTGQDLLFLSGTASITGHESRHTGQIVAQVHQTLDNLDTLIEQAGAAAGTRFRLKAGEAWLHAYVRAREDFETSRACIEARLGREVEVLYLKADICRQELLFEMDGIIAATS
jgi:chorismate lyase / 3-hydroxybenzoate synthase